MNLGNHLLLTGRCVYPSFHPWWQLFALIEVFIYEIPPIYAPWAAVLHGLHMVILKPCRNHCVLSIQESWNGRSGMQIVTWENLSTCQRLNKNNKNRENKKTETKWRSGREEEYECYYDEIASRKYGKNEKEIEKKIWEKINSWERREERGRALIPCMQTIVHPGHTFWIFFRGLLWLGYINSFHPFSHSYKYDFGYAKRLKGCLMSDWTEAARATGVRHLRAYSLRRFVCVRHLPVRTTL